ncbi:MAG: NAD(P)H-dependent oxidoreductase subunit E [Thermoguttaceae bacterium]|jgi:NADH-quinone oxidoreductase subunit E|nr:NAD(P)H-dependent oxidoreductase subunit E [Thermoguttaceae bacterium]
MTQRDASVPESDGSPVAGVAEHAVDEQGILDILQRHSTDRGGLIAVMADIQAEWGFLPEEALRIVARASGRSLVDVYGIATFYSAFSLRPRGKHLICACLGTACHVRGGPGVVEEIERQLGIRQGETTPDGLFTLETVNCLGACALGPVVVIDGHYFSKVRKTQVRRLLDDTLAGRAGKEDGAGRLVPLEVSCPRCNRSLMDPGHPIEERPSIRVTACFDDQYGRVRFSSWYGGNGFCAEPEIPSGHTARLLCPYCHEELTGTDACPACDAAMAAMLVRGGGVLRVCSRQGCSGRRLDFP